MPRRIIGDQIERIRNLTLVLEYVSAAAGHHAIWKLSFTPANVQGCHHVVEQIGRDAARVIPILAESEKTIRVIRSLWSVSKPHLPINKIFSFCFWAGSSVDFPIPFTADRVSVVGALAHKQLADHSILDCLSRFPPLIRACRLRTYLQHA